MLREGDKEKGRASMRWSPNGNPIISKKLHVHVAPYVDPSSSNSRRPRIISELRESRKLVPLLADYIVNALRVLVSEHE